MNIDQDRIRVFQQHLATLAAERGIELTPDLTRAVFSDSMLNGFTAGSTVAALDSLAGQQIQDDHALGVDDEPEDGELAVEQMEAFRGQAAQVQKRAGRALTGREVEEMAEAFLNGGSVAEAFDARQRQLDTRGGRAEFYRERLSEGTSQARDERFERAADRDFDMDNASDRHAYMRLRAEGMEVFEEVEVDG